MSQSKEEFDLKRLVVTTEMSRLFQWVERWGRAHPLWFLPIGTACCALEYHAAYGPSHHLEPFESTPPASADLMIVAGTVTEKQLPLITHIYQRMSHPKWVMAVGACAASGGPYAAYNVVQGIDREIPVDVYVPGCPPTPQSITTGIQQIHQLVRKGISASKTKYERNT